MPPACRPGTAAVAALVVGVAVLLALRGYAQTAAAFRPADEAPPLLGPRVRAWYKGMLAPFEDQLVAWGVRPDLLTYAQLGVSVLAGAAFWTGWIFVAGWLTILAGTLDILDGGVARRNGAAGPRGALIDSVVDRYSEFATFLGLGAFFRESWVLLAVAAAAFTSLMVSYTRARAEALGVALSAGRAQRPERYVVLGFGAWLSGLVAHLACPLLGHPTHVVLATAVVLLAALSAWTALARARLAFRALGGGAA
ncbi:MAG: CDP-alcohol phosphatidyltransferase family protein [Deltaproteobacteria bacterium]|nr:MAG: CDP-alcohol phosphatidyltransferase family protein [Deltaproteobacteria bacterium]